MTYLFDIVFRKQIAATACLKHPATTSQDARRMRFQALQAHSEVQMVSKVIRGGDR
jgi:D-aminopeptidase